MTMASLRCLSPRNDNVFAFAFIPSHTDEHTLQDEPFIAREASGPTISYDLVEAGLLGLVSQLRKLPMKVPLTQ